MKDTGKRTRVVVGENGLQVEIKKNVFFLYVEFK